MLMSQLIRLEYEHNHFLNIRLNIENEMNDKDVLIQVKRKIDRKVVEICEDESGQQILINFSEVTNAKIVPNNGRFTGF
ncbi:hypothetical protein [Facklamia miroungae]|uniref:Uncharacterized protein n=1 Tax=Facklamia miroungae TaxID=120956 RepID=A0A1G7P170_9LACT|nr:hypothetical protein [Facklamia miroungae]NKZ28524.1 hypothetical protein [Facklamia miroungae]SDF79369.1 hypothetical protein SAMN05421791_10166 [Facklamia miroungae]